MGMMNISRKGMIFTFISILLLFSLTISFFMHAEYKLKQKAALIETRVTTMDNFIDDMEKDMERGLYIASFRGVLGLNQYITDRGIFIDNIDNRFEEVVLNSTINNTQMNITKDTGLYYWMGKISELANDYNINVNFANITVSASQSDPWYIDSQLDVIINVQDMEDTASWSFGKTITTRINITEFEDPLYTVMSDKTVINTVRKTPFDVFVVGTNTSNLEEHLSSSYYVQSDSAPSYLMRLEGNLSADINGNGIESLVASYDGIKPERSRVDYIYWANASVVTYYINASPVFRLDNESNHLGEYGCSDIWSET